MTILDSILDVFSSVGTWISEAITNLMPMFYSAENGLTIVGVLAVAGLAFSIVFLLLNVITGFLRFQ